LNNQVKNGKKPLLRLKKEKRLIYLITFKY
jgi:hypothetical protein